MNKTGTRISWAITTKEKSFCSVCKEKLLGEMGYLSIWCVNKYDYISGRTKICLDCLKGLDKDRGLSKKRYSELVKKVVIRRLK